MVNHLQSIPGTCKHPSAPSLSTHRDRPDHSSHNWLLRALPTILHEYIDSVSPTTSFSSPCTLLQFETSHLVPNSATTPNIITPTDLRRLYSMGTYKPRATGKNKLGIAGYLQHFASQSDSITFMRRFRISRVLVGMDSELYKYVICFDNRRLQRAHWYVAIRAVGTQTCLPKQWVSKSYSAVLISLLMVQAAQLRYVFTTTSIPRPSSLSDRPPQESSPS